jgi:hypothetical protein
MPAASYSALLLRRMTGDRPYTPFREIVALRALVS